MRIRQLLTVLATGAALFLSGCGGGGGDGGGGGSTGVAPSVIATDPPDTANGAAVQGTAVTATFAEAIDPATLNQASFTLTGPAGSLAGSVLLSGNLAIFTPATPLAFNAEYVGRLTTSIKSAAGVPLAADHVWRFNTGRKITAGASHTCARLANGSVKCWGGNDFFGQLGLGDTNHRGDGPNEMGNNLPAVDLGSGRTALAIAAGSFHTCARLDNGQVKCWGSGGSGRLGTGNSGSRGDEANEMGDNLPAVDLGAGRTALELAAGNVHSCARLDNGQVKCWGGNASGQLGLGDINHRGDGAGELGDNLPPVDLGSGRKAVQLVAGSFHNCALLDDGQVKCWGGNASGQLGLGDVVSRGDGPGEMGDNLPAVAFGTAGQFRPFAAVQLAAGGTHTCARLIDALLVGSSPVVKCWGENASGQLGLGDISDRGDGAGEMGNNLPAVDLGSGLHALDLVTRGGFTCARLDNGALKCWGSNGGVGRLGLGDTANRGDQAGEMGDNLPALALGTGRTAVDLAAGTGENHNCALLDNGQVKCWANNDQGQLGLGDLSDRGDDPGEMGDNLPPVDLGS